MSVDFASFVADFPEFEPAGRTLVDSKIADARLRIDASVWDLKTDLGVKYLAAHLLALSPFGQQARLVAKDGSTTYGRMHATMVREVTAGFRVA
jgi:hypothetical protein